MSAKPARMSRLLIAMLLALASGAAVLTVHLAGLDRRAELLALDLRFRTCPSARDHGGVVYVDIDDRSLEELGRWPWPRAKLAGIVSVLNQAGADTVALDIILPEPQERRFESAATEVYSGGDPSLAETIGQDIPRPVFDDDALRQEMRQDGDVFVPMHVRRGCEPLSAIEVQLSQLMQASSSPSAPGVPPSFQTVVARVLPDYQEHTRTEQYDEVRRAYLRLAGLEALRRSSLPANRLGGYPLSRGRITPPLVTIAQVCYGSGFVTFEPDVDGVMRRIPLIGGDADAYPQFALALAADRLARKHGGKGEIAADKQGVTVSFPDGYARRIPIDAEGQMLINWVRPDVGQTISPHVSAARVGGIWDMSQSLQRNKVRNRLLYFALLQLKRQWPSSEAADRYYALAQLDAQLNKTYSQRIGVELARMRAMLFDPANVPPAADDLLAREQQIESRIDELCGLFWREVSAPDYMDAFLARPAGLEGGDQQERQRYDRDLQKARFLFDQIERTASSNAAIERDLGRQVADLRKLVDGKCCLVGSVATGAADFVPTPVESRMPGVWVHANILNTIVSGQFIRRAPEAIAAAVIVAAALAVGLLAGGISVLKAGPLTLLLAGGYAAFDGLVTFRTLMTWLPAAAPLAAIVLSFVVVTAYRQLTEERAKRRIRGMFAHALSPALVDRLMEDPSLARLGGERRELTFFFSDLQGFTPIAERLGEENTVRLLNRYFDRMTEVIQNRSGGYLNKFLGDGLFVFFGAPVFQDDHARRAIRCALDCQQAVAEFNRELASEGAFKLGDVDASLAAAGHAVEVAMRIGISSGKVMVGNCGSSQRMDYTAIGPAVNLASRLESANKFFGTRILAADSTWRLGGGEDLLARPLGKVVVVGMEEPVLVWHVETRADAAEPELRQAFSLFAEAVGLFTEGKFAGAAHAFRTVLEALPGDRPSEVLLELCRGYQANPPRNGWDGLIRLAEK